MKRIDRQIPASSGEVVHAVGTFIWLKSATGAVSIKTDQGETALLTSGDYIRTDKVFTEFFITDESGAQNDVTFNISEKGEAGLFSRDVNLAVPSTLAGAVDVTLTAAVATLILAANSNRSEAIITSVGTQPGATRIGPSSVAANRGILVAPGATLILDTNAAIYGFNAGAEIFSIGYTEL